MILEEINLSELKEGDWIAVETVNSIYSIEKRKEGYFASGGVIGDDEPEQIWIRGCTFGGSMIKVNHLFQHGYMEFSHDNRVWTTTEIQELNKQ